MVVNNIGTFPQHRSSRADEKKTISMPGLVYVHRYDDHGINPHDGFGGKHFSNEFTPASFTPASGSHETKCCNAFRFKQSLVSRWPGYDWHSQCLCYLLGTW